MDELAKRFFQDPAVFARAVELLSRYEAVENLDWESVEDYLAGLDEGETELLDTALSHRKSDQLQHKRIRDACPALSVLFRRSLHTRCKREADARSRRWWVIMDELAKRFFQDPAVFARAVELLSRYEAVENLDWESVEDYLAGLDEGETELLDTALSHRKSDQLQQSHQALLEKVALLEKTVEALTNSPPANPIRSILNKMDAGEVAGGIAPSSSEPSLITPPPASRGPSPSSSGISIQKLDEDDLLMAEVGLKFLDYKRGQVTAGSLTSIQSKVDLFLKILTEHNHNQPLRVSELSNPKMRHFRDVLLKMPSKRGGLPKDLSIKAMLKMNLPPISGKTAKDMRFPSFFAHQG